MLVVKTEIKKRWISAETPTNYYEMPGYLFGGGLHHGLPNLNFLRLLCRMPICMIISEFEGEEATTWYFTQDCFSANLEQWFSRICVWVLIGAENKIGKKEMRRTYGVPFRICKYACWSEAKVQISNLQITSLFTCFLKRWV